MEVTLAHCVMIYPCKIIVRLTYIVIWFAWLTYVVFPVLQTLDLILENNADTSVIVQIMPLHIYPNPQAIIDLMQNRYTP